MKVKLLSRFRFLATPRTVAHQAPPSMGFSRQEYWSGLPLPSPSIYWIHKLYLKCIKLISHHRTSKSPFSFQSQRKAMSKNVQTTAQLHSFPLLVRLCSKSFKLGFSSMGIKNFQMYKLDLEKAEESKIK